MEGDPLVRPPGAAPPPAERGEVPAPPPAAPRAGAPPPGPIPAHVLEQQQQQRRRRRRREDARGGHGAGQRRGARGRGPRRAARPPGRWDVVNGKELLGSVAMLVGLVMLLSGLGTSSWVTGTIRTFVVDDSGGTGSGELPPSVTTEWEVGLLRSSTVFTDTDGATERREFDNVGDELRAGEVALTLTVPAAMAAVVTATAAAALAFGRMKQTEDLLHGFTIWGSFVAGLMTIIGAIAYSAVVPKLIDPLTFGYSFIIVLCSGFLFLIGGLVFVLARQEQIHMEMLR